MNNMIALDEALEYLNNNTTDFVTFYKNQIIDLQEESNIFCDFGLITERADLYTRIKQFEAWIAKVLTKLKMFIQKMILKIRSYIDKTIVTANKDTKFKNIKSIKIHCIDPNKINKVYNKIIKEIEDVFDYMVGDDMVDEVADAYINDKALLPVDNFKSSFDDIRKEFSDLKEEDVTFVNPVKTLKDWSKTLSKSSDQLNESYTNAQKGYNIMVKVLKDANKDYIKKYPDHPTTFGYRCIGACTKLVNICTDEIMFASKIISTKVSLYAKLLNIVKENQ